jgi:hypothetical protein
MSSTHIPAVRTSFTREELDGASVEFSLAEGDEVQVGRFNVRQAQKGPLRHFIHIEGPLYTRTRMRYIRICMHRYAVGQADAARIQRAPPGADVAFICHGINPPRGVREVREDARRRAAERRARKQIKQ